MVFNFGVYCKWNVQPKNAYLEKELELSGLEKDGLENELPVTTMIAAVLSSGKPNPQKNEQSEFVCLYCIKQSHFNSDCRKRMKKD